MLKHSRLLVLFLLTYCLGSGILYSQSPRLYSNQQGLANTRIAEAVFDRQNFLWICTDMGLTRFDGQKFTTYLGEKDNPCALQESRVSCFYEDAFARYWVGASDGFYYFCRTENRFTYYPLTADSSMVSVSRIVAHPSLPHCLLVSTYGYGIYIFDAQQRKVLREETDRLAMLLPRRNVPKLMTDSRHNLWSIFQEGMQVVNLDTLDVVSFKGDPRILSLLSETIIHSVYEDLNREAVYLGTMQNGILYCDLRTMEIAPLPGNEQLQGLDIMSLRNDLDGNLLIGTENKGLYLYDFATEKLSRLSFRNCPVDLNHSKIHGIVFDDQRNMWLSLYQKGMLVVPYQDKIFNFSPISMNNDDQNLGFVSSFAALSDGTRLYGIDGGGLLVRKPNGTKRLYSSETGDLPVNNVLALARDGRDVAYIGTYNYGIFRLRNGKVERVPGLELLERGRIMSLSYDPLSHILYIGTSGSGVYGYNVQTNHLVAYEEESYNKWITCVLADSQKRLWIGTEEGAYYMDLRDGKFCQIPFADDTQLHIWGFEEYDDRIWLATDKGLAYYEDLSNQIFIVENPNARPGEAFLALKKGDDNRLWCTSNYGLSSFDASRQSFVNYSSNELSLVGSFGAKSVMKWSDGSLSFGGDNGVLSFDPRIVHVEKRPLKEIFFTRLWINNVLTDYNPLAEDNVLDASLWHAKRMTLPSEVNSFSISFAVQEYGNPSSITYAYRLEGYEDMWHEAHGTDVSANYSNLPWGKYKFQVRASTSQNVNAATFKEMEVHILTPWYAQWWAWLLYSLSFTALALYLASVLRLRARQRRIEKHIEQNRQLNEAKLRLFTSISHEIKTPLTLIMSPLRKLLDMKRQDTQALQSVYELMYRNASRILMLVNQQMDVRKIDNGQLRLHMEELPLSTFLSDIMQYFNNVASGHDIRFTLSMPEGNNDLCVWGDPNQLDKVFFNLLSNAFKFTHDRGEVSISVRTLASPLRMEGVSHCVEISVFNSGTLLDEKDRLHVFERFYQGKNSSEKMGSGIGLNLAYELTELHHGKLTVDNVEDRGVCFTVLLPLGSRHLKPEEIAPHKEPQNEVVDDSLRQELMPDLYNSRTAEVEETFELSSDDDSESQETNDKKSITILFVDDDKALTQYIKSELEDYNVVTASSGNEAWGQLLVVAPQVVVTDIVMPDGDGYELCSRIKRNSETNNIPVIVLTSETGDESKEEAMRCEADRFLNKPVNITLLRGAIEQSLKVRKNIVRKMRRVDMGYDYSHVKMTSADSKLVQRVVTSIQEHIGNSEYNVEELSRDVGMSRVHLNRRLKELLGTSPSGLIKSVRLKQAAYLLVNNDVTVAEVAYCVGFSSPSYFTSNFTSYFGMTPKAFVSAYLANPDDEKLKKLLE